MENFCKVSSDKQYAIRIKLALGKYNIVDNNKVIVDDVAISTEDYGILTMGQFWFYEPISEKLFSNLHLDTFIEDLKNYKKNGFVDGKTICDMNYLKLYPPVRPSEIERSEVGREWVDYEKQLNEGLSHSIIYDPSEKGIWAMMPNMLEKVLNSTCLQRYGNHLMILSPCKDERYLLGDKEIVGDKFDVKIKGSLKDNDIWDAIIDCFSEYDTSKVEYLRNKCIDLFK